MTKHEKYRFYAAAYLVLIKEDQVLLLRRFNTGYCDGQYSMIAGHLDGNETIKQCAIREAKEEAGIAISAKDLDVVFTLHKLLPDREYFDIFLCAKEWSGKITNTEPGKCDKLKWFKMNNLPENIIPEVKFALKNIQNNVHYGELGFDV